MNAASSKTSAVDTPADRSAAVDRTGPTDRLARAMEATYQLVAGVKPDQWTAATPCADWNLRLLVNHLVSGNLAFVALVNHELPVDRSADKLGDDPARAYRDATAALLTAFSRPATLVEKYQSPFGLAPGAILMELRIVDELVHGWDVARATGQPVDGLPEDLATTALEFSMAQRANVAAGPNPPFEASKPVPDGAPVIDRLAAYLGRPIDRHADSA